MHKTAIVSTHDCRFVHFNDIKFTNHGNPVAIFDQDRCSRYALVPSKTIQIYNEDDIVSWKKAAPQYDSNDMFNLQNPYDS